MCRDGGLYAAIQTSAHELGHCLGAPHDEDTSRCASADQFIMAGNPEFLTTSNYLHPFTFSVCSIEALREFLLSLTLYGYDCLLDGTPSPLSGYATGQHFSFLPLFLKGAIVFTGRRLSVCDEHSSIVFCPGQGAAPFTNIKKDSGPPHSWTLKIFS